MIMGCQAPTGCQGPGPCRPGTPAGSDYFSRGGRGLVKLIGAQEERRGLWIQKAGGSWGTEVSRPGKD